MPDIRPQKGDSIDVISNVPGHPATVPARIESKNEDGTWQVSLVAAPTFRTNIRLETYDWNGKSWTLKPTKPAPASPVQRDHPVGGSVSRIDLDDLDGRPGL